MAKRICSACGLLKEFWKSRKSYCKDCCKQHNREWEKRNPAKVKARTKAKAHDPKHQQAVSTYRKLKRRTDPEFRAKEILNNRSAKLKKAYGLTLDEFERMKTAQSGLCAICQQPPSRIRLDRIGELAVDHDHKTGKVRGLLCHYCNSGLGQFRDSPELLTRAIAYLLSYPAKS